MLCVYITVVDDVVVDDVGTGALCFYFLSTAIDEGIETDVNNVLAPVLFAMILGKCILCVLCILSVCMYVCMYA